MPDVWSVYLATDDAAATVDAAVAAGGQVLVPAMDVMELGTHGRRDRRGQAAIGIWQPGLHKGFGVLGEPGTPQLVRAAHPRLRRLGRVLPGRVRVGHPRR